MSRFASVMALWLVGLTAVLAQGQSVPLFRASVDVVELDVTVLDKDRQPVRGLTEKDFTVLEDGKPQAVVAFKAIDLPDVVTSTTTAKWTRSVTPDVTTNQIDNQRLFLIVLDDAVLPLDPFAIEHVKSSARSVINKLGPNDLAAVIFTRDNRSTQDFTNDHAKLLKAVETVKAGFGFPFYDYSIDTLKRATDYMVAVPQQRKTLVYITTSMPLDIGDGTFAPSHVGTGLITKDDGAARVIEAMKETFRRAQRANVNIYSIDACGLRPEVPKGVIHRPPCGAMHPDYSVEFLQTLSDNTGGRAIVNTNDMEPGIVQMFRENNSYYLVGYSPANVKADGTFRRVEVKVDRPDVEVRTRKNYYAPDEKAAAKEAALPQPSANVKALTGMLPKADVALRVTAAPFATADPKMSTVAMALGVERSADGSNRSDDVDVIVDAFTPEGQAKGSSKQSVHVASVPSSSDNKLRYDLLSHVELAPGRYELRLGAHSSARGKDGSVYADVEVPDFAKEPLSLSGVVLSAVPGLTSAPKGAVTEIVPIVPTSVREFDRGYRVTSFLRVYEGGKNALAPVTLAIRIVNDQDASVFEDSQTMGADRFDAKTRAADERVELPLARLAPGAYLLTFEATLGKNTTRRDVRFTVK